jgi:hypothetical protein
LVDVKVNDGSGLEQGLKTITTNGYCSLGDVKVLAEKLHYASMPNGPASSLI